MEHKKAEREGTTRTLTFINVMQFQVELYLIEYFGVKAVVKADTHIVTPLSLPLTYSLSLSLYPSVHLPL